jgi:hypothetical protein
VDWGLDAIGYNYATPYAPDTWVNVTGDLYEGTESTTLARKYIPTYASCSAKALLDISSSATGNVIDGSAGDNYEYCIAEQVNECRTGSSVDDIFVNCPDTPIVCGSGLISSPTDNAQACVGSLATHEFGAIQILMDRPHQNAKGIRRGLYTLIPRFHQSSLWNNRMYPDDVSDGSGRWAMLPMRASNGDASAFSYLIPPTGPMDTIRRDLFVQVPVTLNPPASLSVNNAIIEFGYDENFYCTTRQEVCVAAASNNPYFWAHESFSGVSCASNCTINIPAVSGKMLYYRWKYRDAGDAVLATSGTQVIAVP